jgi:DNA (cytosine-5)-methyltransferase 1
VTHDVIAADLFCGAGGTSSGLVNACRELRKKLRLFAINHWDVAISTHSANHPDATHLCTEMDSVDPRKVVSGGRLNLLLASPECTDHSNARGGKPMSDQRRASAWHIVRWAEALYIDNIIVENVREFRDWGPLGANGRPLKSKRGETFLAFLRALESLDYRVEYRVLNAADYGDPTTRERLFVMARRGRRQITWPQKTHSKTGTAQMFGAIEKWKSAREIIDWSIASPSIFTRKRPLAPATLARIEAGLRKFGGKHAEPFLVILRNHSTSRSVEKPLPTITAGGGHFGLCEPFVLGQQSGGAPRSVNEPLPTVATDGAIALIEPFILPQRSDSDPRSVERPLQTITTTSRGIGLVEPFLINAGGPRVSPRSVVDPMNTVLTRDHMGIVEPFIVPFYGEREGQSPRTHSIEDPLPTVTAAGVHAGLCETFIMPVNHGASDKRSYSLERPMPTITSVDAWGICEPFLTKYNGTGKANSVDEPLDTVTAKDRFALVETESGPVKIDIRFRMLRPHELSAAMSFDAGYKFTGNREDQVKQIGNAVPVKLAEALCREMLAS